MAVRSFNGSSDWLQCAPGGVAISNFAQGAYTILALCNPTTISGTEAIVAVEHFAATQAWLSVLASNGDDQIAMADEVNVYGSSYASDWIAGDWALVMIRKASGTAAIESGVARLDGSAAWTYLSTSPTTTGGTAGTPDKIEFGATNNGDFSSFKDMLLATAAIWNSSLSDANLNTIASALSTQSIADLSPLALWDFNQASTGTAVEDLVGTSDQSAISGTSVVTIDDPPGWTFGIGPSGTEYEKTGLGVIGP